MLRHLNLQCTNLRCSSIMLVVLVYIRISGHDIPPILNPIFSQLPRQCGGTTGVICCTPSENTKPSDCEFDTTSLFENAKKTMMFKVTHTSCRVFLCLYNSFFQIYQIDNFNKKFSRLKGAMRVIKGKGSKQDYSQTPQISF